MAVEVLRDIDVRLRGARFERWLEGAGGVEVHLRDGSLLGAACALPVIEAVRAGGVPVSIAGDGVGAAWLRLAAGPGAAWRSETRVLVLDPARRVARVDRRSGALHVPCVRAHRADVHPMERWARGALSAGLPASRQAPRVDLGWLAGSEARRELRALGVGAPLLMLAPGSARSEAMATVATALARLGHLGWRVLPVGEPTPSTLRRVLARAAQATLVVGDDAGLLHAAAACGAHVMAVGGDTLAPPYPSSIWVRTLNVTLLSDELERASIARFPWDALALRLP